MYRKQMKRGMKNQFGGAASMLAAAAVFLVTATCTAHEVLLGSWAQRFYGTQRADIVEIFGGKAEISLQAYRQGWLTLQPYDIEYGCDLKDLVQRAELIGDLRRLRPRLAVVEFLCKKWCKLAVFNYHRSQARR